MAASQGKVEKCKGCENNAPEDGGLCHSCRNHRLGNLKSKDEPAWFLPDAERERIAAWEMMRKTENKYQKRLRSALSPQKRR